MSTQRLKFKLRYLTALSVMTLAVGGMTSCHQVQLAGGAHLAPPLKPVQSTVYAVRLGSMATPPDRTLREEEVDPWVFSQPRTSGITE
jgi:hypothetical protein